MILLRSSETSHRRNTRGRVVRTKSRSTERRPFGNGGKRDVRGRSGPLRRAHHVLLLVMALLLLLLLGIVVEYWHAGATLTLGGGGCGSSSSGFASRV